MNIFENIQPAELTLKPFITPQELEADGIEISITVRKLIGSDAQMKFINQYEIGYDIKFTVAICEDLTRFIENNLLFAVYDEVHNLQIGDDSGFRATLIHYPPTPDMMDYWVYEFKTDRPNKVPFKPILKQ